MISTLAEDAITLHYQPVLECQSGVVTGLEALMRWHHMPRGNISPEAFIPVFEHSGLIVPLSRWALRRACCDAAGWSNPLTVSVNLSAIQFEADDLPALVASALRSSGLPPHRLELEVTEAALINDRLGAIRVLDQFRQSGVAIVLDDFGTGASAPSALRDGPFSRIKIDARVVAGIGTAPAARSIAKMLVELGHVHHIEVAAKGVETASQLAFLQEVGCDLVQGFHVGRPGPLADFAPLLDGVPVADNQNDKDAYALGAALRSFAAHENARFATKTNGLGG